MTVVVVYSYIFVGRFSDYKTLM